MSDTSKLSATKTIHVRQWPSAAMHRRLEEREKSLEVHARAGARSVSVFSPSRVARLETKQRGLRRCHS